MSFLGLVNDSKLSGEFTADSAAHLRAIIAETIGGTLSGLRREFKVRRECGFAVAPENST